MTREKNVVGCGRGADEQEGDGDGEGMPKWPAPSTWALRVIGVLLASPEKGDGYCASQDHCDNGEYDPELQFFGWRKKQEGQKQRLSAIQPHPISEGEVTQCGKG